MGADYHRILFLFVDGLGLAPAGPDNPLSRAGTATLRELLGGALVMERRTLRQGLLLGALDACLDLPGLPQSATGQTALFTGVNGALKLGRHVTGFPGPGLRAWVEERGIFRRAVEAGLSATFANAYSDQYLEACRSGSTRPSVTTTAVLGAGLPFRTTTDLRAGNAVCWDITRERFAGLGQDGLGLIDPRTAGRHLAAITARHRLTVFETFLTDLAGHGRFGLTPEAVLERIDGLLGGYLSSAPAGATLVLCSDHGNVEDARSRSHTRNPVPLLAVGPQAGRFADLESILDVTPRILECLLA